MSLFLNLFQQFFFNERLFQGDSDNVLFVSWVFVFILKKLTYICLKWKFFTLRKFDSLLQTDKFNA